MPLGARLLSRRATALAGGVFVLSLLLGLAVFANYEIGAARAHALTDLDHLAGIKALQISEWYRERLDDSTGRGQDPLFVATVREWVSGQRGPELAQRIQGSITPKRLPWRYLNVWLLALDGSTLFRARPGPPADPSLEAALLDGCRRQRVPLIGDLHRETESPYLDMCAAVVEADQPDPRPIGIYLQRIDASQLLIPTVEFSTLHIQRAATSVVESRDRSARTIVASANASTSLPAPDTLTSWVASPTTDRGATGTNARGDPVIGAVRSIANTPWHVVVSIPRVEADAPAIAQVREVSLYALALTLGIALVVYEWIRRGNVKNAAEIVRYDRLLQVRSAINEAIVRIHDRGPMLSRFCEIAVGHGRFDFAAVFELVRPGVGVLSAWYGAMPQRLKDVPEFHIDNMLRQGPLGPLFQDGQVVIIPDIAHAIRDQWATSLLADGHRAVVGVPIREHGSVKGFFALYSTQAGVFDRRDSQLFDELAADISYALENVEADRHRRLVEAQLHAISDAAPFAMFLIERATRTIRLVNRAALAQYGYTEDELVGRPATTIFSPDELVPHEPHGVSDPLPGSATHRRKDGRTIQVEVANRAIDIDGQGALVAVALDVTERRELEQQFRQAQRLEAVGRLAGGVAHDFNNLLTVMGGFASIMLRELAPDSPHREPAETIRVASERAAALTSQLLAFSRQQALAIQRVDLNSVVRETASMLSRLIGEDIRLEIATRATRDAVNIDPAQLQQVIMNLAVNARDAMPLGGWVRIITADRDDGSPNGAVELTVGDTGSGIPPEVLDHIFEPFFTTKPTGHGTGLGLSTVHGIVTQSGGTIGVESVVGQGTTFWMRFPYAGEAATRMDTKSETPARGHGTILLVEDDRGVRAFTTRVLTLGGYQVIGCANGFEAVEQHRRAEPGTIDLLLTDVVMPGTSGPEVAERLRAAEPHLAILFMSGYADEAASRLGLNVGAMDVIKKPFEPDELLRRVAAALQPKTDSPPAP